MNFGLILLSLILVFSSAQAKRSTKEVHLYETESMDEKTAWSKIPGEAPPHAFPYNAAISENYTFICSGALITPLWVITSANRVVSIDLSRLAVHLGFHNFSRHEPTQQMRSVDKVIIQDEWTNPNWILNNLALLQLNKEAILNDYVKTVLLAPINAPDYAGSSLQYAYDNGTIYNATVFGISDSVCQTIEIPDGFFGPGLICVVGEEARGFCDGNFGSPIIDPEHGILIGLYSSCNWDNPVMFTRISYFNKWIAEKIG